MLPPLPLQTPMLPLCLLLLGSSLTTAYDALKVRDYDRAIAAFHAALRESPDQVAVRKDLAYTLLKTGDTEAARDQFAEVLRSNPNDFPTALEYAYLCYETKREAEARRTFDRVRTDHAADPATRAAAQQAFDNIDAPLALGLARWQKALESDPHNFSAHEELAVLAEKRGDLSLAASHYDQAWHLRLARRDMLLALGRVWQQQGKNRESIAVLLSVSRGSEPRLAEQARALLPNRYPYPYEFQDALKYDPGNAALAQELGYLLEAMGEKKAPAPPPSPRFPPRIGLES